MNGIIRVFPQNTSYTPDDDYVFIGLPPLQMFIPEHKEVHISCVFTWDRAYCESLAYQWEGATNKPVKLGGPAFGSPAEEFIPGMYIKAGITYTTRGCNNQCPWCIVPKLEGRLKELPIHAGNIIQDNNFLQASRAHKDKVFDMLRTQRGICFKGGLGVDLINDHFNTGLEMNATKRHVKDMEQKYGVEIKEVRPKKNIVISTKESGIPFVSKIMSSGLSGVQRKNIPLSIADEYANARDKPAMREKLRARYPKCESEINFLCCCNSTGEPRPNIQLVINSSKHMLDFIKENPIPFKVSCKCCDHCKKQPARQIQKGYDMVITGERRDESGMRSVPRSGDEPMCFTKTAEGKFRFRPLYYVSDVDKQWYKNHYGIKYSDAYEVYGLKRTGCCGCSISAKAVEDLEKIRPHEPNVVKAAWNIFGESYLYRQKYNEYKAKKRLESVEKEGPPGAMREQISLVDLES